MDHIAVLIPCYNEALTIGKVVHDFSEALPEAVIYVYDNNSTDDTAAIAEEAGAVITDPQGRPLTYDGPSGVIGASGGVVKEGGYLPADVLGDRWNLPEI